MHAPVQITLIGSDGKGYTFLAKPKDDLRKDHRMMEVAGVINRLFAREPVSRRRNLYLRRYAFCCRHGSGMCVTSQMALLLQAAHSLLLQTCMVSLCTCMQRRRSHTHTLASCTTYCRARGRCMNRQVQGSWCQLHERTGRVGD